MNKTHVLLQLLRRDLLEYKRKFWSKLFDSAFLLVTQIMVFGYFLPVYGMSIDYGPFILISSIASFGFFDIIGKISTLISDIEGDRKISYTLTLPIPSWMVFFYIGTYWAINSALITVFLFPLGKLILFNQFDLEKVSYLRLIPMFISINVFYGFFSLWLTSMLKSLSNLDLIWIRVINPIVMFGAYFYSWQIAYKLSPSIAYFNLINPMVYVMEGMRAASLGQEDSLPFWICMTALWIFIFAFGWHATRRLQNRLDCVK